MDTGTVPVSHIHTVDVSVNCHCVCTTFHTGNTGMMKDGLKGKEIFVKLYLQNKNRKTTVVTRSASCSHIPTGNQDSTYTTGPEFVQTRPEKPVFYYPLAVPVIFNCSGVLVAGGEGGSYYSNVRKPRHLALTLDSRMINRKELGRRHYRPNIEVLP